MEISKYLVERGADGDIFLHAALGAVRRIEAAPDANPELVHAPMDKAAPGGYVYLYTSIGRQCTPLHAAATHDQVHATQRLLSRGADPNAREPTYDGTSLGCAMHFNYQAVAELLRPHTVRD